MRSSVVAESDGGSVLTMVIVEEDLAAGRSDDAGEGSG